MVWFLVRLVAMQMLSIIADYSLVFRCGSWSCSLMVVFSHGGSQICSREDVIMNVLSWWCSWFGVCGGHADVIMNVRSWPFFRGRSQLCSRADVINYSRL